MTLGVIISLLPVMPWEGTKMCKVDPLDHRFSFDPEGEINLQKFPVKNQTIQFHMTNINYNCTIALLLQHFIFVFIFTWRQ